jgi:hypothetical protein
VTPAERQTLSDAQSALLEAMLAAARAAVAISALIITDKSPEPPAPAGQPASDRTMTEAERQDALRPKPGPPRPIRVAREG